ncbi:MAG: hypothetical protein V1882_09790 [Candidatus Omnitrophota bacterium]
MKEKKPSLKIPKPRHGWTINPKTRVTPSRKNDLRKTGENAGKDWVDELFD